MFRLQGVSEMLRPSLTRLKFLTEADGMANSWLSRNIKSLFPLKDIVLHRLCTIYKGKRFYGKTYLKETIKNDHNCSNKRENYKQNSKPAKYFQDNSSSRSAHKILSLAELVFH